jgi:hypothetical protein
VDGKSSVLHSGHYEHDVVFLAQTRMDQPVSNASGSTYHGSHLFLPMADAAGLSIDQFNFLLSEVLALIFAIAFRRLLPANEANTKRRHFVGRVARQCDELFRLLLLLRF